MEYIEVSAKNVDDAITEASIQLGTTSDQIEYEVIEKGSTGFLGIGSKNAVIKARKKYSLEGSVREFLGSVFAAMKMEVEVLIKIDEVRQKMEQGEGAELFTPLDQIFAELPAVTVTDAKAWMSYNGNDLPERFLLEKEAWTDGQEVRVYDSRKNFIGLYQYRAPKKLFHIKKMFLDPEAEKIEK